MHIKRTYRIPLVQNHCQWILKIIRSNRNNLKTLNKRSGTNLQIWEIKTTMSAQFLCLCPLSTTADPLNSASVWQSWAQELPKSFVLVLWHSPWSHQGQDHPIKVLRNLPGVLSHQAGEQRLGGGGRQGHKGKEKRFCHSIRKCQESLHLGVSGQKESPWQNCTSKIIQN